MEIIIAEGLSMDEINCNENYCDGNWRRKEWNEESIFKWEHINYLLLNPTLIVFKLISGKDVCYLYSEEVLGSTAIEG